MGEKSELFLANRPNLLALLIQRDGLKCSQKNGHGCGYVFGSASQACISHLVPIYLGGAPIDLDNLELLCSGCLSIRDEKILLEQQQKCRVFVKQGFRPQTAH